ncbi:MAG: hypothetical protein SXU28_07505 [Pseudomonadota bacterium]|nr:hypothetical protein [Pseudomonadota bacterium]
MARAGGAKLKRSETVTVRLDPKLNYLCELASRAQRRTKSSFIEWSVAEVLKTVHIPEATKYDAEIGDVRPPSISEEASSLWHVDEADRVVALGFHAPALMTHDEQIIWKLIKENGHLWKGRYDSLGEWSWELHEHALIKERLRVHWEKFKAVAAEEASLETLPAWQKTKTGSNDDFDDDIPF